MESLTERVVRSMIPGRRADQSKKDFGRLLIMAGQTGMAGAAVLCGKAALRSGVGLATFYVPSALYPVLQTAVPEATCLERYEAESARTDHFKTCTAFAAGPGLGHHEEDRSVLLAVMASGSPFVLDADGLNDILRFGLKEPLRSAASASVLTPHEGEAARLLGTDRITDRQAAARALVSDFGSVVVLKGHHTLIAAPDGRMAVNPTGCAAMAKGGSGDVLTGVIGAFLAKGMPAYEAACAGVFLHGRAGDLSRDALGEESVIARDLIEALPRAFLSLGPAGA
ncbi:MAG: NAD(P)H-hydrate dehydratase [Clostridiales bacterium]|nr:NAD(P)H-hydrate dehydratase [Clostridiales bacterium]